MNLKILENMRILKIVVLAGAGISTDSGIPDFRGPNRFDKIQKQRRLEYTYDFAEIRKKTGRLGFGDLYDGCPK